MHRQNTITNNGTFSYRFIHLFILGAWCAYDGLPWIQVNFKVRVYITGLITQIISESYYVSTFSVKHGDSSSVLTYVTTSTGSVQIVSK